MIHCNNVKPYHQGNAHCNDLCLFLWTNMAVLKTINTSRNAVAFAHPKTKAMHANTQKWDDNLIYILCENTISHLLYTAYKSLCWVGYKSNWAALHFITFWRQQSVQQWNMCAQKPDEISANYAWNERFWILDTNWWFIVNLSWVEFWCNKCHYREESQSKLSGT